MKLIDALTLARAPLPDDAPRFNVALACGCSPLHLQTFLTAHLRSLRPDHRVEIETGLYGDCLGNLRRLVECPADATAVVLEWSDFDPRLGIRQLGGWSPGQLPDILETVRAQTDRFREAFRNASEKSPVAVSLPSLPLPPVSYTPGWHADTFELELHQTMSGMASDVARLRRVRVVAPQRLDRLSAPGARLDARAELATGFPYRMSHATALADLLSKLLCPQPPKKGIITDLDNVLWRGILGDVGVNGVTWDLDHHSHGHALFQQMLCSLAEAGVLIGVASKNDPGPVDEVFRRNDMILSRDNVFPLEVHWGAKSESVGRILRAWNIGADSVVFVDDTPMELAEAEAAHPGLECLLYPVEDDQSRLELLDHLRDLFGKESISREDALRLETVRRATPAFQAAAGSQSAPEEFLKQVEAEITLDLSKDPDCARALELVNKTNQFNLNGRRFDEGQWREFVSRPETFLLRAAYRDKFGPLGTIAVIAGQVMPGALRVDTWVMSCRAFSRRIEHRCLEQLYEQYGVAEVALDFEPTPRNGPLQDFLSGFIGTLIHPGVCLSRATFGRACPRLFQKTTVKTHA